MLLGVHLVNLDVQLVHVARVDGAESAATAVPAAGLLDDRHLAAVLSRGACARAAGEACTDHQDVGVDRIGDVGDGLRLREECGHAVLGHRGTGFARAGGAGRAAREHASGSGAGSGNATELEQIATSEFHVLLLVEGRRSSEHRPNRGRLIDAVSAFLPGAHKAMRPRVALE